MIQERALQIATGYIGEQEVPKGSNGGPFVLACLAMVGITYPAPWCMAFAYRCYAEAARSLDGARDDNSSAGGSGNLTMTCPVVKTAGVLDCWNRTGTGDKLFQKEALSRPELVTPGMQFILKEGAATGHTGIVESVQGHLYYTIEGNSNSDGSREGFAVVRHQRDMNDPHLLGFIRY